MSQVDLLTKKGVSFTVTTVSASSTPAFGVIKGKGNGEMVLDNVLLSESLSIHDTVLTKGDIDSNGVGLTSGIVVGEITSIDKKPSSLFQTGQVKSPLDFSQLSFVFIAM